jgi:D-alanyl-D-alanine carboxypeptidase
LTLIFNGLGSIVKKIIQKAMTMYRMIGAFVFVVLGFWANADTVQSIRYFETEGAVEFTSTGENVSAATPFAIASIGKTMTSVALLRLVSRGKIGIDDAVSDWVTKDIRNGLGGLDGITLRHLLNMTSGLPDYLSDEYIIDATNDPKGTQSAQAALTYAYDEAVLFQPGMEFDYSNTNYVLAGMILELASGLTYEQVIAKEIFGPSAMHESFVFGSISLPHDFPQGHENGKHERAYYEHQGFGDGGVISTARDLSLFYNALFREQTLLTAPMMSELIKDPLGENYGMGLDVEGDIFGHSGGDVGFASDVRMNVETGAIAIIFEASADADISWASDVILGQ